MKNTNNSFALFLNIILGLLFIGSLSFSYFFGNFGGISIKELNEDYLLKGELSFKDLPKNAQKKYINRSKLSINNNVSSGIEKAFDDEGNPLVVEAQSMDEFGQIVKSLQEKVMFLEKENIFLSNDKDDLLKIVEHEKSKNNTDQKTLLSTNLEKINEAEQQHYKNISQLTVKINDLQRENIRLAQQINGKNDTSNVKIEELEKLLLDEKKNALLHEEKTLEIQKSKYSNLENEKKSLQQRLNTIRQDIESQKSDSVLYLGKKDQRITVLQNKINELMLEKHDLLTKNSQSVLEMEQINSKKLQEFNDIIKNSSSEKEAIKTGYIKMIAKLENEYKNIISEQKKEMADMSLKLQKEKHNSVTVLGNSENMLSKKDKEYKNEISRNKTITKNLNKKIKSLKDENKILISRLETKKTLVALGEDKILQLQDKIKTLDKNDRSLDDEVNERVKINEEKHNTNYKILNEKIATLEQSLKLKKSSNSKVLASLSDEKAELINKLNRANNENSQKNQKIIKLQDKISKITKQKNTLELSENEKLAKIKDSFDSLQKGVKNQEKEYNSILSNLKQEIANKDTELYERSKDKEKLGKYVREITMLKKMLKSTEKKIAKVETTSSSDKTKKLVKVDSIECNDMNSGNFKITSTCKVKVDKFLNKYSTNNFFEIIPIVGTGGFASLNLIKRKSKLGIADKEIERLTKLANLGLGKDRAKEAGWLIKEKFGDGAKISYTVYNIEVQNKRGFVIRVYK